MCQRCDTCEWYLAGIVSEIPFKIDSDCSTPPVPIFSSRLVYYEDWIISKGFVPFDNTDRTCSTANSW